MLLVTLILQIIGTAQVFLEPYLFTSGGPANATLTVLLLIYDYAFGNSLGGDYGKATALSLMLAGFLALFSLVYLRATRSWSTRVSERPRATPRSRSNDWRRRVRAVRPRRRRTCLLLVLLVIVGLGPLLWLAKSAITPTIDTHQRTRWRSSRTAPPGATCSARLDRRRTSAAISGTRSSLAFGSWLMQIVVATTGGFALSVLRPRYATLIYWLLLATLFVPAIVLLVPLYIEIVRPPLDPPLVRSTATGPSGCPPARARSTSCW